VPFGWRAPGRRSVPAYPSFTGRRWIPTEYVNLFPASGRKRHRSREEVRPVPFGWRAPGRRSVPAHPSFTGRRWIPTEYVNLFPASGRKRHRSREEVRPVPFGWRAPGRRSVPAHPSFTGRRWIPTEFVNLFPAFGEETAPVAGGGATGAIWVAGTGEEVGTGPSVVHREEVDPDGIRQSVPRLRGGTAPVAGGGATGADFGGHPGGGGCPSNPSEPGRR
jgi:hypothetical protein